MFGVFGVVFVAIVGFPVKLFMQSLTPTTNSVGREAKKNREQKINHGHLIQANKKKDGKRFIGVKKICRTIFSIVQGLQMLGEQLLS